MEDIMLSEGIYPKKEKNMSIVQKASGKLSILLKTLPNITINAVCPYVIYSLASPHMSLIYALLLSAIPPLISSLIGIVRQRRINLVGAMVLLGLAIGTASALLFKEPRLLLISGSLVTGVYGVVMLVSLLFPRPLIFTLMVDVLASSTAQRQDFAQRWQQSPQFRQTMNTFTIVWGISLVGEFVMRVIFAYILPVAQFLLLVPLLQQIVLGLTIAWSFWYNNKRRKAADQQQDIA
jgi:hypothetical protein